MVIVVNSRNTKKVVLVVEDEPLILMNALDLVEEAGYEVIAAQNADEAITLLESRSDIRIVFTDIDMPGSMDGLKLAAAIRDRWPPIELLVTSGRYDIKDDELPSRGRFISKPYTSDQISHCLHDLTV